MTDMSNKDRPLSREIATLLIVKIIALTVIWYTFFREPVISSMIDGMDPEQVSTALLRHQVETHQTKANWNQRD